MMCDVKTNCPSGPKLFTICVPLYINLNMFQGDLLVNKKEKAQSTRGHTQNTQCFMKQITASQHYRLSNNKFPSQRCWDGTAELPPSCNSSTSICSSTAASASAAASAAASCSTCSTASCTATTTSRSRDCRPYCTGTTPISVSR